MHVKGLFKKKHYTLRKKEIKYLYRDIFVIYACLYQKKKANVSTLATLTLFWKVDLRNRGEEGSHRLFYFILI